MITSPILYPLEEVIEKKWVSFTKKVEEEESISSSLPFGQKMTLCLSCDSRLCTKDAQLILCYDKTKERFEIPFVKNIFVGNQSVFTFEIEPSRYCKEAGFGLFFFSFQISCCYGTLFTLRATPFPENVVTSIREASSEYHTPLKLSVTPAYEEKDLHPLTVYSNQGPVSHSLEGAIIYHVFVDRFAQGDKVYRREDAPYDPDWHHGIPEYAKEQGESFPNNTHFGGSIEGIVKKLPYIQALGADYIYLSPIFRSYSNHKYDTGDYMQVDELFGGTEALVQLISQCKVLGIKIILDGVFNHTGDNSLYFNRYGTYPSLGAYQSPSSPYYSWYDFKHYPDDYESWWGVKCLPGIRKDCEEFWKYIAGDEGVIEFYTKLGVHGFRLDVVDELNPLFLHKIRNKLRECHKDTCLIGEVWEDASVKIAYEQRRQYFSSLDLDGVISYPFRKAILDYLQTKNAPAFANTVTRIVENYPHHALISSMNVLSTHDTERIATLLGNPDVCHLTNDELASYRLSDSQREEAKQLQRLAAVLQFTLPGAPTIYYGDEISMEGGRDPFNRRCFPWGEEDTSQLEFYQKLSALHSQQSALQKGSMQVLRAENSLLIYRRTYKDQRILIALNASEKDLALPEVQGFYDCFHKEKICDNYTLKGRSFAILT